jgi:DNA-binding NarL/FixJ family response regulator
MDESLAKPIRLLLVDDHEIVRVGLRAGFQRSRTIEVIGEAATAAEAVAECSRLKPDLVLLDVRLPDGSGVDVCREIRTICPDTRVLFLTSYADANAMMSTVLAGAHGFLLKHVNGEALTKAVETVAQGQSILDPALTEPLLEQIRAVAGGADDQADDRLSPQERKVLALVAEGKTNKEIAVSLDLSDRTVKNYLSNAFEKLHVTRRSQAAVVYARLFPPR